MKTIDSKFVKVWKIIILMHLCFWLGANVGYWIIGGAVCKKQHQLVVQEKTRLQGKWVVLPEAEKEIKVLDWTGKK